MPVGSETNHTAVTPGRKVQLYLDTPQSSLKQPPFWLRREKMEMLRAGFTTANSNNVWRQGHGGISLRPYQDVLHYLSERTDNANAVIPLSMFHYPAGYLREQATWKTPTDLTGVTVGANVASGDAFLRKIVPAGENWNSAVLSADATAYPSPTVTPANVPMRRLLASQTAYGRDQHYTFRWILPGSKIHTPHIVEVFFFGDYCVDILGNGAIQLHKKGEDGTWTQVDDFRYSLPYGVVGSHHLLMIFPHLDMSGGGWITFFTQQEGASPNPNLFSTLRTVDNLPMWHRYRIPRPPASASPLTQITPVAPVRVDSREDMRVMRQVSLTRYPTEGYAIDENFALDMLAPSGQYLTLSWEASVPDNCSLLGSLYNANTNTVLTLVGTDGSRRVYEAAAGVFHYYARFDFTSDETTTPMLFAYQVIRDGVIQERTGTSVEATEFLRSVSVTQSDNDPTTESASFELQDIKNSLTVLGQRGRISAQLKTQYDPTDATKKSVLWQGHLVKNTKRRRIGKRKVGMASSAVDQLYPSPLWHEYNCMGVGEWLRLSEKLAQNPLFWDADPAAPGQAYKVTDIARTMLGYCGYASDEIDVPDNAMRLFPGAGGDTSTYLVQPMQSMGDYIVKILRDYLGWYLVWDANAGTRGKWRALAPKRAPYTSLATFKTTAPTGGKLVHRPESYGSTGWWSDTGSVTTFVRAGTYEVKMVPPEANMVTVYGITSEGKLLKQWIVNRDGGDFFTGYTVDPTNPDFIGDLVPLIYVDTSLAGQPTVDLVCRRLFDVACHAVEQATFEAPLILITDPADTSQTKPRPLRYYDPITLDNDGVTRTWLVKNVVPQFTKDVMQMATYEIEAVRI